MTEEIRVFSSVVNNRREQLLVRLDTQRCIGSGRRASFTKALSCVLCCVVCYVE